MKVSVQDLRSALAGWDGRRKDQPLAVCKTWADVPGFEQALTKLSHDPVFEEVATWCLKWRVEQGGSAPAGLVSAAAKASGWATKLHVLQILDRLNGEIVQADLEALIAQATASDKPMLRAWGYTGADICAHLFPATRAAMQGLLTHARATETAGSIKARLKRCRL